MHGFYGNGKKIVKDDRRGESSNKVGFEVSG